ncbi:MAG: DUF4345 domain-containing protein [Pseudomonadota bacterium]
MTDLFRKLTLGAAGSLALTIGFAITAVPAAFHATNGIALGTDPTLLSEIRAPGAMLAASGGVILAGAIRRGMARLSAILGALVFLSYAAGRIVGATLDGLPADGIIAATVIELVIGGLCAATLMEPRAGLWLWRHKARSGLPVRPDHSGA